MVLVFQNNYRKYKRKDSLRFGILNSHAGHQPLTECAKKQPRCQKKNIEERRYAALLPASHYPAFERRSAKKLEQRLC